MCDSPSLFILSVLCVVVSISGRLYFCIFSCDPLLFLSAVLCPYPQAIGALLFLYAVWWDGQKLISFLRSGGHMMEILFIVLCVLWCCVVLSLLSALEMCVIPGHRGDIPPGGLHFCRRGVWRVGRDVFNFHDTGKIWMFRTSAAILLNHNNFYLGNSHYHIQDLTLVQLLF